MESTTCSAWNPSECEGTAGCPARCPRFVDKRGELLLVEPYDSEHYDGLVSMYEDYPFEHQSMGIPPVQTAGIERWLDSLLDSGSNFIARDGDRVIGHAAFAPEDDPEPELIVFVAPDCFERGIGTELCFQIVAHATESGAEALVLDVDTDNDRAIHVYRKMGFEVIDETVTDVRMRLSFGKEIAETVRLPPAERSIYA